MTARGRGRGRIRVTFDGQSDDSYEMSKNYRKSWQFLIELLENKETNPSIIRWIEEDQGKFEIVQPEKNCRTVV